jgi:hypothetical protein
MSPQCKEFENDLFELSRRHPREGPHYKQDIIGQGKFLGSGEMKIDGTEAGVVSQVNGGTI